MVYTCFYRGDFSLAALVVRLDTRRPGQPFADVPGHMAIVIGATLYEMVSGGWHSRPALPSDMVWSIEVLGLDEAVATATALSWRGTRYGWWVDALIGLSRFVPARWMSSSRGAKKHICSAFVKFILEQSGWPCPHWLAGQDVPECPNDLWFALRKRWVSRS